MSFGTNFQYNLKNNQRKLNMKNITICVDLNEQSLKALKKLKGSPVLNDANVILMHLFEIQVYTAEFTPFVFPTKDQYPEIEKSTLASLEVLAKDLGVHAQKKCLFVHSKEDTIIEELKNNKSDLVIVSTQNKSTLEGIFHTSFTSALVNHSPCDVYVVRP